MGYANDTLTAGQWKPVASQFLKIGSKDGSDMVLGDLKPGDGWAKTDFIKILNSSPSVELQARFVKWNDLTPPQKNSYGNDPANFTEGWYQLNDAGSAPLLDKCLNNRPLPFGTAILACAASGSFITSNGEVLACEPGQKIELPLPAGAWVFVANCTPVKLTFGDFKPGDGWAKTDFIKILNASPSVEIQARFVKWNDLTPPQKNSYGNDPANFTEGWYQLNDAGSAPLLDKCLNSREVPAGNGFLACAASGSIMTLPAAL